MSMIVNDKIDPSVFSVQPSPFCVTSFVVVPEWAVSGTCVYSKHRTGVPQGR